MTHTTSTLEPSPAGHGRNVLTRPIALAAALLVAAGIVAYSNSLSAPFVFDDLEAIRDSQSIRQVWNLASIYLGRPQTPVTDFTLAINYAIGGQHVLGYHIVNLLIHLLAALTLFGVVRRTLLTDRLRDRFSRHATWLALAVAGLWMLHPVQTESVTYLIQRKESQMGLFYLVTLYCAIRSYDSPRRGGWVAAAAVACVLGMGSKQVMMTAPVVVLLYDRLFVSGSFRGALRRSPDLHALLAAAWLMLLPSLVRVQAEGLGVTGSLGWSGDLTTWSYARSQFEIIVGYVGTALWPTNLCIDYLWSPADAWWRIWPFAVVVLGLFVASVAAYWRRRSAAGFAGLWFLLLLAPTSSVLVITELRFDHRLYLPLAGLVALVVLGGYAISRRNAAARAGFVVGVLAAAIALSVLTFQRNEVYRSPLSLWQDTVAKRPQNGRAYFNLGMALQEEGQPREALEALGRSNQLRVERVGRDDLLDTYLNRAQCLVQLGRLDEALVELDHAFANRRQWSATRHDAPIFMQRGIVRSLQNRWNEAFDDLNRANALDSKLPKVYYNRAVACREVGQYDDAIADCNRAIELDRDHADAYCVRGRSYMLRGQPGDLELALADTNRAVRIAPGSAECRVGLAQVLKQAGRMEEALAAYDAAIRLDKRHGAALEQRGELLLGLGRKEESLADLNAAVLLSPNDADVRCARGVTLLALQRFDDAAAELTVAVGLNPKLGQAILHRGIAFMWAGLSMQPADRASLEAQQKRLDQAFADFNRCIELNANWPEAYVERGKFYHYMSRQPEAIADYGKAIELKPDLAAAYENRAVTYMRCGKYDLAWLDVAQAEKLGVKMNPDFIRELKQLSGGGQFPGF